MSAKKITNQNRPWLELTYPCWVRFEGHNHAGNIWRSWERCPNAGHVIMSVSGEDGSSATHWHPDQDEEPADLTT